MRMPFIEKEKATLGKKDGLGENDVSWAYVKTKNHHCMEL